MTDLALLRPQPHPHSCAAGLRSTMVAVMLGASVVAGCAPRSAVTTTAQPSAAGPRTGAASTDAIAAVQTAIRSNYLYADRIPALVAALDRERAARGSDSLSAREFATRVTAAMQAVSPDGHLYLRDDSARYAAAIAPSASAQGLAAFQRREALRKNHGLARLELLPGGIRYLRVSGFMWTPGETQAAYDAAIGVLSTGEAVIIDVRGNAGGESDAADYLLNAILPPRTMMYTFDGVEAKAAARTGATRLSGTLASKLLYVLVDGHTGSAAEAFAYALQQSKAATIVGDPTFGAANNNREIPIAPRFMLSVSYRRPRSPISGTNWEGTGVTPDLAVPAVDALAAAEVDGLDRLIATAGRTPDTRSSLEWARVAALARLHPPVWTSPRLERLAGTYGATRVQFTGDGLRLTRTDRPKWHQGMRLIPLTEDGLFAVEAFAFDDLRVRISDQRLEYLYGSEDVREAVPRNGAPGR